MRTLTKSWALGLILAFALLSPASAQGTKISDLPAATTPLSGAEIFPLVQGGVTKQTAVGNVTGGGGLSDGDKGDVTVSGGGTVWNIDASTIGTSEIVDSSILSGDLNSLDAPADEECLTFESSSSQFEWQTCGAGGGGDSIQVEDGDNAGTFTAMSDANFDDSGDINFTRAAGPPDVLTATVRADSVALTTDTTGNYAAGDAEAGNALTGDSATAFFSAGALEVARGGTGAAPAGDDQAIVSDSTSAATWRTLPDSDLATQKLQYDQTTNTFSAGTDDDIPEAGDLTVIDTSAELRTLLTDEIGTGVLVFLGAPADDQVPVGDSASATTWRTLPDSDLATQKLQYDQATNSFSAGTDDDIPDAADYSNLTGGTGIVNSPTGTIAFSFTDKGADPALNADECVFTSNTTTAGYIVCEGDTANTIESRIAVTDPTTADKVFTLPDADSWPVTNKDYGDITVGSAGQDWQIDADTITATEIAAGAVGTSEAAALDTGDITTGTFADARIDGSLEADEVNPTLGTQTQGNYVADVSAGTGIAVTGSAGEGWTPTVAFSYSDKGSDVSLNADECVFSSNATTSGFLVCEGDTADTFESRVAFTDPTADRVMTIPNANSNPIQPLTCGGTDKVSAIGSDGTITCSADAGGAGSGDNIQVEDGDNGGTFTAAADADFEDSGDIDFQLNTATSPDQISAVVRANSVALGTDTTNDYVATVADGTGIDGTATGEGSTYTPSLDTTEITSNTWGVNNFTTQSFSTDGVDLTWDYSTTDGAAILSGGGTSPILGLDDQGVLRLYEEDAGGSNFLAFQAPAAITTDATCVLENDANFIPDSCVGDGSDDDIPESGDFTNLTGGTGITVSAGTVSVDGTELGTVTWGAAATVTWTFDVGVTDLVETYSNPATLTYSGGGTSPIIIFDDATSVRFNEEDAGGSNYKAFAAPATITTDTTCTFEDDANFIPDSCVGDGSDDDIPEVGDFTNLVGGSGIDNNSGTLDLDLTEINSATFGSGTFTTLTFDAGATDPVLTFGSGTLLVEAVTSFRQADAANAGGFIKLLEDPGTGSNFIGFQAPASITSDVTCTLENDANPIPDSCVGDGTDASGSSLPADPGANSVLGWDDTANQAEWWNPGTGLTASTTTIDCDTPSETAVGCIELATTAEAEAGTDTSRAVTAAGLLAAASGKQTIYVSAAAMKSAITSGAACGDTYDSGTNDFASWVCAFDTGATEERADFILAMPKRYNGGTLTYQYYWTNTGGSAAQTVQLEVGCAFIRNDDALNATLGTTVTQSDTWIAVNDLHVSAESGAMTCGGTWADNSMIQFRVSRDTSVDTMSGDLLVLGIDFHYTSDLFTDD